MECILYFLASEELRGIMLILTFISVIVGGIFALKKWNKYLKLNRAEYVKKLLDEIRTNESIDFYLFEYNEKWYNKDFHSSEIEKKVDFTLEFFSYICYLKNNKIITESDFDCFKYDIVRIIQNKQFCNYCYNLYHFSSKFNLPMSFNNLFIYAKKNHYFNNDFWDPKSDKYPHYLNF